ncbi:chromatin target of PRMT1 protein-like [Thunnus thynnus]|uniref:chromatin target of PRMT1 protein-like n=1 Tax=Thunnus thynnus TaxID=8237 RepID=UPI003528AC63
MDSSKPDSCFLRSTSAVSLNERFSQVLDQLTRSRTVTFDPLQLQQRRASAPPPVVLLVKREPPSSLALQVKQRLARRSVWTRLGWRRATRRLAASGARRGFWSFRNKYRWRAALSSAHRRQGHLWRRLGQRRRPERRDVQTPTAGRQLHLDLRRGGAAASRGRGLSGAEAPTRKQLDAQLDEYMSTSRSRLDKQLEDYMSLSRSRLDAELDEYMSMAGQTPLHWD